MDPHPPHPIISIRCEYVARHLIKSDVCPCHILILTFLDLSVRYFGRLWNRSDGIGWISVLVPDESDESDDTTEKDVDGLLDVWDDIQDSGEPVTFQKIQQLAVAHG